MSNLINHMEREFRYAGLLSGTDSAEEAIVSQLRQLVTVIASQNHSGSSLFGVLQLLDRLVNLKPLTPLTGADSEWVAAEHDPAILQNVRCSTVFKIDGKAVDAGMKPVYITPDGVAVTRSTDPAPEITFPYMPGLPPIIEVQE